MVGDYSPGRVQNRHRPFQRERRGDVGPELTLAMPAPELRRALQEGRVLVEGTPAEIRRNAKVQEAYLGGVNGELAA